MKAGWYILVDRKPVAVGADEYARWMTKHKYEPRSRDFRHDPDDLTRVGWDEVGPCEISTVFLGLDHGWGDGPPSLFETMVFGGAWDQDQERYCTWDEAEAGHKATVEKIRRALAEAQAAGYEVDGSR